VGALDPIVHDANGAKLATPDAGNIPKATGNLAAFGMVDGPHGRQVAFPIAEAFDKAESVADALEPGKGGGLAACVCVGDEPKGGEGGKGAHGV
jgi:hypothetical protein